eukprot:761583-Hanusia_phi.AAC.10
MPHRNSRAPGDLPARRCHPEAVAAPQEAASTTRGRGRELATVDVPPLAPDPQAESNSRIGREEAWGEEGVWKREGSKVEQGGGSMGREGRREGGERRDERRNLTLALSMTGTAPISSASYSIIVSALQICQ